VFANDQRDDAYMLPNIIDKSKIVQSQAAQLVRAHQVITGRFARVSNDYSPLRRSSRDEFSVVSFHVKNNR
jgi:hypothetical protein